MTQISYVFLQCPSVTPSLICSAKPELLAWCITSRMMIGRLPTYTDGEFETAIAAINEAIINGMADQNSSGESDLYALPILCMLNFYLMNHAKIDTIL